MNVTNGNGCTNINAVSVIVNAVTSTSVISGENLICQGATNKVYQVDDHSGSKYTWSVPGNLTKTFDLNMYFIMVNATAAGSGDIQVFDTITATGCVGPIKTFTVTVSPLVPGVPTAGPTDVCKDAS